MDFLKILSDQLHSINEMFVVSILYAFVKLSFIRSKGFSQQYLCIHCRWHITDNVVYIINLHSRCAKLLSVVCYIPSCDVLLISIVSVHSYDYDSINYKSFSFWRVS